MNTKQNKQIEAILSKLGFESLKPMQSAMVDACRKSDDIILLSPTGSGKTLAFLLPVVERLNPEMKNKTQVFILAPARELAQQIERVFRDMGTGFKVVCCYGGHTLKVEKDELLEAPAVLIGTPGRILDHMERGRIDIESINTLILDEFDKALELGFTEEMSAIIAKLTNVKRRMLTSATDADIPEYTGMQNPEKLNFLPEVNQSKGLVLKQVKSPDADKLETLYRLLCETGLGKKLVFCNYRESVERVSDYLLEQGIPNSFFHGGMEQPERERALIKFRNGSTHVFVSTDLASRGLDIPEITDVIHYHLPNSQDAFIHRNGRTARMNAEGAAYLILGPDEYLPEYVDEKTPYFSLSPDTPAVPMAEWVTLYIGKGKKDKLSKIDIVGFLIQQGGIQKTDIGIIDQKEYHSYVAIRKSEIKALLKRIQDQKIKKMKTKFALSL